MQKRVSAAFDGLPPIRAVMERLALHPQKALGQNFLLDFNLLQKITAQAGPLKGEHVLEIGPGPGGLTRAILAQDPASLTVIEKDARCLPALRQISAHYPGKLTILQADALSAQKTLVFHAPVKIIANLPYNVGATLLAEWLTGKDWPPFYQSMTLMFQREVARRILANPGGKDYGRLSVLAAWRCQREHRFDIPPQAFIPAPKVTSSVIHLQPRQNPLPCQLESFLAVTKAAFAQRRKMLRQSLKPLGETPTLLTASDIDGTQRAEQLDVTQFVRLANALSQLKAG